MLKSNLFFKLNNLYLQRTEEVSNNQAVNIDWD